MKSTSPTRLFSLGPIALAAGLLSGCASVKLPPAAPPAASTASAAAASAPAGAASGAAAARPDPAAPKPFEEVVKGATRQDGFFPVWRKDEKVWLEIPAERLGKPFLLSAAIASSVGERGLYASSMGPSWLATFRQVHKQVQLIALNTEFVARNPAMQATVAQSFSDSLLAAATLASAEHPQRKSLLVDASFLLVDLPAYTTQIEAAYRLPFALDRANSAIQSARVTDDLTTLNLRMHFATPRIPAPPLTPPTAPLPAPPATLPDPRSLFAGFVYNFSALPEPPMAPREADPRLGHFSDVVTDLSDDLKVNPRVYRVNRWRLEKADPLSALSEPKQPIVFWLDRNIPPVYRKAVEEGILEWNKAFEKIGFRNAIVAKQQADDADWDTLDARHASVRWFTGADAGFARGPSHTDPRSGEIIDADIMMSDVFGRGARRVRVETVGAAAPAFATPIALPWSKGASAQCDYAEAAAAEMEFAFDLLEARGELAPDSPEAEAFAQAVVRDTITHEVGHALGLKHNFKASTVYSRAQLQDAEFTAKNGIAGSVMDYSPYNLALAGERRGALVNSTIGPYDYWAIEYAYKPIEPGQEKDELQRIAARSTEPLLAYADDTDAGGYGGGEGLDPLVNRFDLGSDPLEYYRRRLALSRELWQRVQERSPQPGEDVTRQRRVLLSGFSALGQSATLVGKYVGGMQTSRDLPGTNGGRPAYQPVPPAKQREALRFLADGLFAVDAFRFKPQFLASLSPDYREWTRGGPVSIPAAVLQLQTGALDRLLSPGTATRLLELPLYLPENERRGIISLHEVVQTLQGAVWSELQRGGDIEPMRRNLQREHLKRVQALLTRSAGPLPADAVSLVRLAATELQAGLRRAAARPGLAVETRAHLQDSLVLLSEALRASFVRG